MRHGCDLCGLGTFLGRNPDERFCPHCRSYRPMEKIEGDDK